MHAAALGYKTVGAIMTDLNRPAGKLFAEALDMMRLARSAYAAGSAENIRTPIRSCRAASRWR